MKQIQGSALVSRSYWCPSSLVVAVIFVLVTPDNISVSLEALNGRRWAQEEPLLRQQHYFTLFTLPPPKTAKPWTKIRSGDWWKTAARLEFSGLERKQNSRVTGPIFPEVVRAGGGILRLQLKLQSDLPAPLSFCVTNCLVQTVQNDALSPCNSAQQKHSKDASAHVLQHVEEACGRSDQGANKKEVSELPGDTWQVMFVFCLVCGKFFGQFILMKSCFYSDWVFNLFTIPILCSIKPSFCRGLGLT